MSSNFDLNIQCPASEIKTVHKANYLEIIFDNRLNFYEHIKTLEAKIARSVGIFKLNAIEILFTQIGIIKVILFAYPFPF